MLWGLLSALGFGTADYVAAKSSRQIGVYSTLFFMQVVGFVLLTVVLLVTGIWTSLHSVKSIAYASLWMFVDLLGILFLYRGLQVGQTAVVAPIASSFAVVTVILALFFGETVNGITLAGIGLAATGVIFATINPTGSKTSHVSESRLAKGALWAVLAALMLGTAFFGLRGPVEEIGEWATVWIGRLQASLLLPLFLWVSKKNLHYRTERPGNSFCLSACWMLWH